MAPGNPCNPAAEETREGFETRPSLEYVLLDSETVERFISECNCRSVNDFINTAKNARLASPGKDFFTDVKNGRRVSKGLAGRLVTSFNGLLEKNQRLPAEKLSLASLMAREGHPRETDAEALITTHANLVNELDVQSSPEPESQSESPECVSLVGPASLHQKRTALSKKFLWSFGLNSRSLSYAASLCVILLLLGSIVLPKSNIAGTGKSRMWGSKLVSLQGTKIEFQKDGVNEHKLGDVQSIRVVGVADIVLVKLASPNHYVIQIKYRAAYTRNLGVQFPPLTEHMSPSGQLHVSVHVSNEAARIAPDESRKIPNKIAKDSSGDANHASNTLTYQAIFEALEQKLNR